MKEMKAFFGIFKEATDLLQTSSEPTSHLVVLLKEEIVYNLKEFIQNETNENVKSVAESTLRNLENRLLIRDEFVVASFLDPGQKQSSIIEKYLDDRSMLELLKSLWDKYFSEPANFGSSQSQNQATPGSSHVIFLIFFLILFHSDVF